MKTIVVRLVRSAVLVLGGVSLDAAAQTQVIGMGSQEFNSAWNEEPFVEIAAGGSQGVGRLSDGSVVVRGNDGHGQNNVPPLPPGLSYVEVAVGGSNMVARYEPATFFLTPFCAGDTTGIPCPCTNCGRTGRGCNNDVNTGGRSSPAAGTPFPPTIRWA